MNYRIEKNIPIPPSKGPSKYPFKDLEIGDSFKVYDEENGSRKIQMYACVMGRRLDKKFVTRKNNGFVRIWRVK